jgi:hypothetical protein
MLIACNRHIETKVGGKATWLKFFDPGDIYSAAQMNLTLFYSLVLIHASSLPYSSTTSGMLLTNSMQHGNSVLTGACMVEK